MADTRYFYAPIDQLPVELLSHIFMLGSCLSDKEQDVNEPEPSCDIAKFCQTLPTTVSAVNKRWRKVALSTARLWSTVCITKRDIVSKPDTKGNSTTSTDGEPSSESVVTESLPNTTRLTQYLLRSRKAPLDILIDARDPEWDFTEPESPIEIQRGDNTFTSKDMRFALSHLIPHVSRWRSLNILTDTWAPMYTALAQLSGGRIQSPGAVNQGRTTLLAPMLESLTLMRCNEYASYVPAFSPSAFHSPAFLPFTCAEIPGSPHATPFLPKLKHVVLSGVHVDWSSLPSWLSTPNQPASTSYDNIETLELSYHCDEVRPSEKEFRQILETCDKLVRLVIRGSGPAWHTYNDQQGLKAGSATIALPQLKTLRMGFVDSEEALGMLSMINAEKLKELEIEDIDHQHQPGFREENASELLIWLGTGVEPDEDEQFEDYYARATSAGGHPPFPLLETLRLRRLEVHRLECFKTLYASLPNLLSLTIDAMPICAVKALKHTLPTGQYSGPTFVCPNLARLHLRGIHEQSDTVDNIAAARAAEGNALQILYLKPIEEGGNDTREWEADLMAMVMTLQEDFDPNARVEVGWTAALDNVEFVIGSLGMTRSL